VHADTTSKKNLLIYPLLLIGIDLIHEFVPGISPVMIERQRKKGGRPKQKKDWAIAAA
jgi:hypothetical protein